MHASSSAFNYSLDCMRHLELWLHLLCMMWLLWDGQLFGDEMKDSVPGLCGVCFFRIVRGEKEGWWEEGEERRGEDGMEKIG